jgi:hypothetical protein
MACTETDCQDGTPIPKVGDHSESKSLLQFQAPRLARLCAVNATMAETIVPLVFLGAMRQ